MCSQAEEFAAAESDTSEHRRGLWGQPSPPRRHGNGDGQTAGVEGRSLIPFLHYHCVAIRGAGDAHPSRPHPASGMLADWSGRRTGSHGGEATMALIASTALEPDIDNCSLTGFVNQYAAAYKLAKPFPHVVIDNFANSDVLEAVLDEFPTESHPAWHRMYKQDLQSKFACNLPEYLGPMTRAFLNYLNAREVVNFLSALTGIEGLIPDPHLAGGGLHEIRRGGLLRVHADFNWHRQLRLDRRINLLLYLNKDWRPEWGGQLQLWDDKMSQCYQRIDPIFNRCVIFNTTDRSYHGHPDPLQCPAEQRRRSIAMYYYTNGRPAEEVNESHETLFQLRPGEGTAGNVVSTFAKRFVPPIAWDALRQIKTRLQAPPKPGP
jgi:Rps23 Pro-64 3,4-dihydroxylase Tpa1-like proline 4-hydroxylase